MIKTIACALAALLWVSAHADPAPQTNTPEPQRPGDTSLPSSQATLAALAALETGQYAFSVEDYFKRPDKRTFRLSPDGLHVSYRQRAANGRSHVYVKNLRSGQSTLAIREDEDLIEAYFWANNSRLLYFKDRGGDENYSAHAVNIDGTQALHLTPFDGVKVGVISELKDDPAHIVVAMNKDNPELFEPYLLNIADGALKKLFQIQDPANPVTEYYFDQGGQLKALLQQTNGIDYLLKYRSEADGEFATVKKIGWQDQFTLLEFNAQSAYPHDAYVATNLHNDTIEIVLYDLKKNAVIQPLFKHPVYDIDGLETSRRRHHEIDYYHYQGERPELVPVSARFKDIDRRIKKRFGAQRYSVVGQTEDEATLMLYIYSDRHYGAYHTLNVEAGEFTPVFELMPQLPADKMAAMQPMQFKTRDGLQVHGYLTLPPGAQANGQVPLIVNPHGGPYGVRDDWGFNPEVQLFASRGYATLQINYRGSGGYGKKFMLAGSKQIGRNMLNDLEDGVAHALKSGHFNPQKIAIYGGSYGGLATLGSLVKTPDLYTCGVDYVGVSNLFTFFAAFPPYWKPYLAQVYAQWYDENDPADQAIMRAVSPALNVDQIKADLFIVQGANDPRVNIDESDQMVRQLRARGLTVPYMVKYNEGHGFAHEENRLELYRSMMGFFAKCLK